MNFQVRCSSKLLVANVARKDIFSLVHVCFVKIEPLIGRKFLSTNIALLNFLGVSVLMVEFALQSVAEYLRAVWAFGLFCMFFFVFPQRGFACISFRALEMR